MTALADTDSAHDIRDAISGKALVVTASVGAGHDRAAESVGKAWNERSSGNSHQVLDVLPLATPAFRWMYRDGYLSMVKRAPAAVAWMYQQLDHPPSEGAMRRTMLRNSFRRLWKAIESARPDTIISSHFLTSELLGMLKRTGQLSAPLTTVVTDFDVHGMWAAAGSDRHCVATDAAREVLLRHGIARERISVTGIPIDPDFSRLPSRAAARSVLGLPDDRLCLLLSGGGLGLGMLPESLERLMAINLPMSIVAIAGRSTAVEARLRSVAAAAPPGKGLQVRVLGFTKRMHEYMAAADLYIGKPGGMTSAETCAAGLPMVMMNPLPGQEERNATHLIANGTAVACASLGDLAGTVDRLLRDGASLAKMRTGAVMAARPGASASVASAASTPAPSPTLILWKNCAVTQPDPSKERGVACDHIRNPSASRVARRDDASSSR